MAHEWLLEILKELSADDFKLFQWFFLDSDGSIPKSKLENATILQTVNVITQTYPDRAVEVTKKLLKKIQRNDLVERLPDAGSGCKDGPESKRHKGDDQDKLTSNPTGLCVNINTINIFPPDALPFVEAQPGPSRKLDALKHSQKENMRGVHSTPQKMPPHDDTATGFLHCVTPIKRSKSTEVNYFNAVLQTGPDELHQTVIYAPEKHPAFKQAEDNSTPVKLSGIKKKKCPDFSGDSFEVEVSEKSCMVETTVPFEHKKPTDSAKMEIVEVLKLKPKDKIGKLHAQVTDIKDDIRIVNFRGENHEVKECWICDLTGRIKLELWDNLINEVKINTSYEFSNISTRHKPEEKQLYLTCTKDTRITTIPNLVVPKHPTVKSVDEPPISISGKISGIDLNNKPRCGKPHCGKSQMVNTQTANHKCEGCRLKQPVADFTSNVSGTIVMTTSTGDVNLTVPPSPLTAYLTSCNLLHLLKDTDELENHFLDIKNFDVHYSAGNVLARIQETSTMTRVLNGPEN